MPASLQLQLAAVPVRDPVGAAHGRELVRAPGAPTDAAAARRDALAAVGANSTRADAV